MKFRKIYSHGGPPEPTNKLGILDHLTGLGGLSAGQAQKGFGLRTRMAFERLLDFPLINKICSMGLCPCSFFSPINILLF